MSARKEERTQLIFVKGNDYHREKVPELILKRKGSRGGEFEVEGGKGQSGVNLT